MLVKTLGAAVPGHMDKEQYAFCWIVDFPMYEIGEESGELEFCHNPFSMPAGGLEVLLKAERGEIDPLTITADQYDLVCNGVELSSGAVRNHDPEIMVKAFEMVRLGEEDVKAEVPRHVQRLHLRRTPPRRHRPGRGPHGHAAGRRGFHPGNHPLPHEQERAGRDDGAPPARSPRSSWTSCISRLPLTRSKTGRSSRARWRVQAFCTAKPCRRRNSFPPSRIICQGSQNGSVRFGKRAPSEVTQKQLNELHIQVTAHEE